MQQNHIHIIHPPRSEDFLLILHVLQYANLAKGMKMGKLLRPLMLLLFISCSLICFAWALRNIPLRFGHIPFSKYRVFLFSMKYTEFRFVRICDVILLGDRDSNILER